MKSKIIFNRKSLKSFRSSLRNRSTSAEAALWVMLKSRKLEGRKFRRQYSIGSYIVDFCCPAEKLVIELDGAPHGEYHKIQEDENRDKFLKSFGFTVLRFENRFVFQEPDHPGRNHPLQCFGYYCAAATPPSKGGETSSFLSCKKLCLSLRLSPR
jgi:very-short-patch-repair endonuclease